MSRTQNASPSSPPRSERGARGNGYPRDPAGEVGCDPRVDHLDPTGYRLPATKVVTSAFRALAPSLMVEIRFFRPPFAQGVSFPA